MARTVSSTIVSEVTSSAVGIGLLAEMEFDSGVLRLWNGIGDLTIEGNVFTGVGTLGEISPITETAEIKASGIDLSLAGMNSDVLSLALTEDYQERDVSIWFAFFDTSSSAYLDRILMFRGRMDVMTISENGDTSTISLTAESILVGLERARERRFTDEDQQGVYPGDKGFEFVTGLQQKDIPWGRI